MIHLNSRAGSAALQLGTPAEFHSQKVIDKLHLSYVTKEFKLSYSCHFSSSEEESAWTEVMRLFLALSGIIPEYSEKVLQNKVFCSY